MITITVPNGTRSYGVYDATGTWTQADASHLAEALAVMDAIPTVAGSFAGTVYEDTDELYAVDTDVEFDVTFYALLDGVLSGTLTTVSDATLEIIINLLGETLIENNHGRSIMRRLPTGSAWHDNINKALVKGTSYEFRKVEIDIKDTASIDNMLFGNNLANWQSTLSLTATGTLADQKLAIIRKLSDIGGLQASDLTRELHNAGFTNLYAYANKFAVDCPALTFSEDTTSGEWTTSSEYKSFVSINPLAFRFEIPFLTFSSETTSGEWTTGGALASGADLVVNSSRILVPINIGITFVNLRSQFELPGRHTYQLL